MFKNIGRSTNWFRNITATTATPGSATNPANVAVAPGAAATTQGTRKLSACSLKQHQLLWNQTLNTQLVKQNYTIRSIMSSSGGATAQPQHTNRLAKERSPYLLQHAHNPVDWYPWGDEAIQRAKQENKIIFLSVGYSTCHWCHVMEHESFENVDVAKLMNEHFINIKVDREERPDIDKIYMQFVLMMNGSGGWPMSVWLTPELGPITAGTYFPPHDRWGMPSFTNVLSHLAAKWQINQAELTTTGAQVIDVLKRQLSEKSSDSHFEPGSADAKIQEALRIFKQRYDSQYGGFGSQPKFPEVSRLNFLFHAFIVTKDIDVLDMVLQTLRMMARGGIHDHVFGGFSRYSVDRAWHVPHFEKMLYDQGQLMVAYANAYKLTRETQFLRIADGIFRYIMKDLRHPNGGFYAGEDADSLPSATSDKKVEGAFFAWTAAEIRAVIEQHAADFAPDFQPGQVFDIYAYHYDVRATGNVEPASDPHGHLDAQNILIVRQSEDNTCAKYDISVAQLEQLLSTANAALCMRRNQRPRPHLDTKIITSWNGLVLSGLAKLANCGSEKRDEYMQAAKQLVDFIRAELYDAERKVLLRSCYGIGTDNDSLESVESVRIEGFLDDYSFLIKGLLDYYKASLDGEVLKWAKELQDTHDKLFWDSTNGAYFFSQADSPNVILRLKEDSDGAEPCGNSVAARNLILLSHYFDDDSYRDRAVKLFDFFGEEKPFGYALPEMLGALCLHDHGLDLVAVVGPDTEETQRFVEICRKFYIPGMIILHVDPQRPSATYSQRVQQKFKMVNDKPTVYICHDKVCRMPVTDPVKLEENLTENFLSRTKV